LLGKLVPKSFRHTVLLLVWAAVTVPLLILCVYQVRTDYQRHIALQERELAYQTERLSFSLTQVLLQLMGDLDRIASDGSVIRSLSMPVLTPISVQKIEDYLAHNNSAHSVMLIDKELFPIEVLPPRALNDDISGYEGYMVEVMTSPSSIRDPRPRMFIPPVAEGQTQTLIFIRPILTAGTSLLQPFQVDGMLLVVISVQKLMDSVTEKHQSAHALLQLLNNDQVLYREGLAQVDDLYHHQATIILGLDNQSLVLELGRSAEGVIEGVLTAYRTLVIVMLIFIVFMLVVVKRLADKLVWPLKLLSEVTASMSSNHFHHRIANVVDTSKVQYREFSEVFELLGDMERIIGEQFQQLHEANTTLEEKVAERTDALRKNIQLLDRQRHALQQLVQYSMHAHQHNVMDELGSLSLELAEGIGQQTSGLYLLRSEFFSGCEHWGALSESLQVFLRDHRHCINDYASLIAFAQEQKRLHVFPIGGAGDSYKGFFVTERSTQSEQASEALMVLSTMLSSAIFQHSLHAKLHQLAHMDSVTGLPNRHFFNSRFKEKMTRFDAADGESQFGVCMVDVNGLKAINDNYGHQYGDEMLTIVAQALKQTVRANDTVARVGGDEFYIILENATADTCALFAERLQTQCSDLHMTIDQQSLPITFSMGYACTDRDALKSLLILADERMYFAKKKHYKHLS
jgi:diguanylate cyclase (GGDEF)-like protein